VNEPDPTTKPPQQTQTSDAFVRDVEAFVDRRQLISAGQAIVVAVSGGCDSMALLAVLRQLAARPDRRWQLSVAHLNHRLRCDADADAAFVGDLAERWDLPCVVEAIDVAAVASERAMSVETAARAVRYEFLTKTAKRVDAAAVATGHHADDNVETILQRIVRGTHLRGLRGIPAERDLAGAPGIRIIRPLLGVRREQIEQFCLSRGLAWRTDSTNADTVYRRNFIRHELLPLMRDRMNPRVDDALLRLAGAVGDAEDHLAETGRQLLDGARRDDKDPYRLVLDAARLADAPTVQRCYALRAGLEALDAPLGDLTAGQLADLAALPAEQPPSAITLPGNILARREADELILQPAPGPVETPSWHIRLFAGTVVTLPDGRIVRCEEIPFDPAGFVEHCAKPPGRVQWLDADYVRGAMTLRPRRDGDAFVPLGAPGRQTVSNFLTNSKLSIARRREVFVVADQQGVIYVAPLRIADHTRIRESTKRVLRIEVLPASEKGPRP